MTDPHLPLAGRTVLVARSPQRGQALAHRLRGLGADVLVAPVTMTAPPPSAEALDAALGSLHDYAWVAVTSVNAVEALCAAASRDLAALAVPPGPRWAAVGPATAHALEAAGVPVALEAAGTAADLVACFPAPPRPSGSASTPSRPGTPVARPRVLLPLGDLARDVLAEGLRARGWEVDVVVAYRTVPASLPDDVAAAARTGRIDLAVVAAGSAARQLTAQLGHAAPPVVTIGRPSADAAAGAGLAVVGVAEHPTVDALTAAIVAALARTARAAREPNEPTGPDSRVDPGHPAGATRTPPPPGTAGTISTRSDT